MVNLGVRKYGKRGRKPKAAIEFSSIVGLQPALLSSLEHVFVVDLTSFSNKTCNKLLHQMLFGKVKESEEEKVKIFVIMKTKFAPQCKECGIGNRDSKLFIKDRFIHGGNGRVILNLTSDQGSLDYRKQLTQFVYKYNKNLIILSEDKQYGYKIMGSSVPDDDPEVLQYLEYFDISHIFDKDSMDQDEQDDSKRVEQCYLKAQNWLQGRLDKGHHIHMPKNLKALEKSLEPFCNVSHPFPMKKILNILRDAGDLSICDTCQTAIPKSTNVNNQFYFSYKTLNAETQRQCQWMILHIIQEYIKTPTNQVPLKLSKLTATSSAPSQTTKISTKTMAEHLLKNCKLFVLDQESTDQPSPFSSLLQFDPPTVDLTPTPTPPPVTEPVTPTRSKSFGGSRLSSTPKKTFPSTYTPSSSTLTTPTKLTRAQTVPLSFTSTPSRSSSINSNYFSQSTSYNGSEKIKWLK